MSKVDARVVSRMGGFVNSQAFGAEVAAAYGEVIDDASKRAEATLAEFSSTIDAIKRDARLTATGKGDTAAAAAKQAAADIAAALANKRAAIEQAISRAREAAPADVPPPWMKPAEAAKFGIDRSAEWAAIQARAGEIRRALADTFDPQAAWAEFVRAAREGDSETVYAVASAPVIVRRRFAPTDEAFAAEIAQFMRKQNPEAYAKLEAAQVARRALNQIEQQAWAALESIASGAGFSGIRISGPSAAASDAVRLNDSAYSAKPEFAQPFQRLNGQSGKYESVSA
jgi:hypothetical protein